MSDAWIADRMHRIDASGIRKVFDLAATMKDPVNLSIGQPDFPMPEPVRRAFAEAIDAGKTGYSQTQGIRPLIDRIQAEFVAKYGHADRQTFITSGTSGGLMLALEVLVNPGDEVICFDPWFVMYKHLVTLCGGTVKRIDTYPDFRPDVEKVRAAITPRTKVIILNSPNNPTGATATREEVRALAELAAERNIALISDEIYRLFCYDESFVSAAEFNPRTIVVDGFSKSHAMTGLRLGWCHGPKAIIDQMAKLQQFTFVCAPTPAQWAGLAALDCDMSAHAAEYRRKRDFMKKELGDLFEIRGGEGAFYLFLKSPWGTATEFVTEAIRKELLIIPGSVFSESDTHFRLSFAAPQKTLERGVEILRHLVRQGGPQACVC